MVSSLIGRLAVRQQSRRVRVPDERGVALVEYALLVAGVVATAVICVAVLQTKVLDLIGSIDF